MHNAITEHVVHFGLQKYNVQRRVNITHGIARQTESVDSQYLSLVT